MNVPSDFVGCVCTIGNFDGIHLGHQALIKKLVQQSQVFNLPAALITFEPQPNEFFTISHSAVPSRLMRLKDKYQALQSFGLDYLICLPFNQKMAHLSAEAFIQTILVEKLKVAAVFVGDDFRFGYKRQGDIQTLWQAGAKSGFKVVSMDTYTQEALGVRVSSSAIRMALQKGDLDTAEMLLGQKYRLSGKVSYGNQRGRTIGFPTANICLCRRMSPVNGVYIVKVIWVSRTVYGVANIGTRPTVGDSKQLLEVHLFDFNESLYGQTLTVEFIKKLRDEKKFESFDALRQQISKDVEQARLQLGM